MKNGNTASDWMDATKSAPPRNNEFEVLHFGDLAEKHWLIQKGKWDEFGFCGVENEEGEHCKVSTITHWRISNEELAGRDSERSADCIIEIPPNQDRSYVDLLDAIKRNPFMFSPNSDLCGSTKEIRTEDSL